MILWINDLKIYTVFDVNNSGRMVVLDNLVKKEYDVVVSIFGDLIVVRFWCELNVLVANVRYEVYKCIRCYLKMSKYILVFMSLGFEKYLLKLFSYF